MSKIFYRRIVDYRYNNKLRCDERGPWAQLSVEYPLHSSAVPEEVSLFEIDQMLEFVDDERSISELHRAKRKLREAIEQEERA